MLFFISLACVAVRLKAVFLFVAGSYIPNRQCTMLQKKNLRPVSNVVLLPCRTQLIELNSTFARHAAVARRLKPSRATAV